MIALVGYPGPARAGAVIVLGTVLPDVSRAASVVLPTTNMAEEEGTFTNLRGRVQRYLQAKSAPGMSRPIWWLLSDVLSALGAGTGYYLASDVFDAMARGRGEFSDMRYDTLGLKGRMLAGTEQPAGVGA